MRYSVTDGLNLFHQQVTREIGDVLEMGEVGGVVAGKPLRIVHSAVPKPMVAVGDSEIYLVVRPGNTESDLLRLFSLLGKSDANIEQFKSFVR